MRKAKPKKRVILPDPVFNDQKVSKFVNHLMYDGKKNASYEIFYNALDTVKEKMAKEEKPALEIWKQALDNITPQVEVKSRRIGGATFQVPTEIRPERKESISMKNLIAFARKRGGKSMADKLAALNDYKNACPKAGPVLMEPVMKVEVVTPEENMGDVIGDLNKRRGQVEGMEEARSGARIVKAMVPLAEMFGYVTALRTITSGRATSSMEYDHHAPLSSSIAKAVLEEVKGRADLV